VAAVIENPTVIGVLVLAGLGLISIWTSGARAGRKVERGVREVTHAAGTAMRAVVTALIVGGIQWVVLAHNGDPAIWAVVLGVPALCAGITVARLFAVTAVVRTLPRRGGR
jgi:hypothetical protein